MDVKDVGAWLGALGLERYLPEFEANDIDAQTLPVLTSADLIALGVTSIGHRRKLLDAIAALGDETEAAEPPVADGLPAEAERRQLSVLYCDLVGSTALSERLDPEDYCELIRRFHEACLQQIAVYDGWVANFLGDCVLAYFGWPRAHEDDVERAVRAGLTLVRKIESCANPAGLTLQARVGIATGSVVVGDLVREGPAQEQSAVGVAPNLGARLQALAQPGQVVIDSLTRRLLGAGFTGQSLGEHSLKGIADPVAAFVVSGERSVDTRFDARREPELMPIVGREHELALLMERWVGAQGGEGQAVLLVGEAGIGKSRLVRAMLDGCAQEPHRLVRWQCSPYHMGSALWPVSQRLGRAVGLQDDDSTDVALDKIETALGNADASALYATLLGLNGAQRYGPMQMSSQMLRERTLELLVEQLLERTEEQPLLLVVEDAHWIDPTTLELLERCLEKIDAARLLIVVTSRPDNQPGLAGHPSVTRLSLNRLRRASVEAIVARLGGEALQAHTRDTIVARSDGVPMFVEELTKAVLESGEAAVPASLHGSLLARLDRVPGVKEVAQLAACIGREFELALLEAVAEKPETVAPAIEKLVSAELVFRVGERARPKFIFKHALVQEAAYQSMLRSRQHAVHMRILSVLEGWHPDTLPQVLAHHASRARLVDKAVDCWQSAGKAALAKSAYREAIGYLRSAIELIEAQTDGNDRRTQQKLELLLDLGQAHVAADGYTSVSTRETFSRAEELVEAHPQFAKYSPRARYGTWVAYLNVEPIPEVLRHAVKALAAAQEEGTTEALFCGHRMVAGSYTYLGDLAKAHEHFDLSRSLLKAVDQDAMTEQLGWHPESATCSFMSWVLCMQGYADQSRALIARAHEVASTRLQVNARAYPHMHGLVRAACAGDRAKLASDTEALAKLAVEHGLPYYKIHAEHFRWWAILEGPQVSAETVVAHERKVELAMEASPVFGVFVLVSLARALAKVGRPRDAMATLERVVRHMDAQGAGWYRAEAWRVRGEIALGDPRGKAADAAHSFEEAIAAAQRVGAKLWELRAATGLARLLAAQGQRCSAVNVLAPVYEWFSEGFDTADLIDASALLRSLDHRPLRLGQP